ncbi:DUF2929 domain-containing protein [Vagococcus penaei]|uniref:DUF2929 domain-containing protein n=1 Tax=Vagococcus penaei TaxID=633807 RepID=A0A1Q2D351_9ENTE|nr:YjzD family protein [Vagococcus penaei]AQP52778.1 DUF2929 domain-containing protein [Vagococcus penaei]RST98466.1 DUF2929 domain-containing protein [Vagococcus penaei]
MGKLVVLIWSFLLGQVVGYIGGALNQGSYDFVTTTIVSLIGGVLIMLLGEVAKPAKSNKQAH